jgi:glucose-1-phosphate thymidylyltransferase
MRGVILAGGSGSRLWPLTKSINKHFLPIYDKPMIHYPLATLMLAGINEVMIISTIQTIQLFKTHFGDGRNFGISLQYEIQEKPEGIPQGISIASKFIGEEKFCLILGDNIFHGSGLGKALVSDQYQSGAKIFCYPVSNPSQFGVAYISKGKIEALVEKPMDPRSKLAITGMYFFDTEALNYVNELIPSQRGELEIVDLLNIYRNKNKLSYKILPRGTAWLDTGTPDSLLEASKYIEIIEKRQGLRIASLEEIAWRNNWISHSKLQKIAKEIPNPMYRKYLLELE